MQEERAEQSELEVVEICAGAGGQSLGLHRAGFRHRLAVELDANAHRTLLLNIARISRRPGQTEDEALDEAEKVVRLGDVASPLVWDPAEFEDVDLLAGGVPCPPFSMAGKQLGANDERDLFAWAVELCGTIKPKALLLENVRGLSATRFSAYRQHVLDRLRHHGYIGEWRLLEAKDFGVPQLRPRFVLVALKEQYAKHFHWPEPNPESAPTVGEALRDLMGAAGWEGAEEWAKMADNVAPTIVGGSKKHGGADLGPTRAKKAWSALGVDAMGVADAPPAKDWAPVPPATGPKLTTEMVARIQGWSDPAEWEFTGRKTTRYRQIGNAFPPPVAEAVGRSIARALRLEAPLRELIEQTDAVHDPVYRLLAQSKRAMTADQIAKKLAKAGTALDLAEVERRINHISHDFSVKTVELKSGGSGYRLQEFKAFIGQQGHARHEQFERNRAKIS
jgi:DNA (cytosine-5)-methyltransferase 1